MDTMIIQTNRRRKALAELEMQMLRLADEGMPRKDIAKAVDKSLAWVYEVFSRLSPLPACRVTRPELSRTQTQMMFYLKCYSEMSNAEIASELGCTEDVVKQLFDWCVQPVITISKYDRYPTLMSRLQSMKYASLQQFCDEAEIPYTTLLNVLKGTIPLSDSTAQRICRVTGLTIDDLKEQAPKRERGGEGSSL